MIGKYRYYINYFNTNYHCFLKLSCFDILQAHELTGDKLRLREVVTIDVSNDPVKTADYKPDEDPTKFRSERTGRGPLQGPEWWKKVSSF